MSNLIYLIITATYFFICIWLFNHVNVWLGIALSILGVILIGYLFKKQLKQ